jgi:hypothetical protein
MVHEHARLTDAKDAMIAGWDAARRETPQASQIMLAYRRDDVRDLNARARTVRQAAGELGADHRVVTERGARDFAAGDRVYFLKNERSLGVKNGTLGTVTDIAGHVAGQGDRLVVRLDDGRSVGFDVKDYAHIDHGYAATVHKSQGVTVDRTHVLATSHMDRHAAYVGLSRHRERVDLHWSADQVGSRERLSRVLGRERLKDTSLDYGFGRTEAEQEIPPESRDSVRAYAERRGLVPESEIVVRERPAEVLRADPAKSRRGLFTGLKLEAGAGRSRGAIAAHAPPPAPTEQQHQKARLEGMVVDYARAWSDTERMRQAALPVLPHQAAALEAAGRALAEFGDEGGRDVRAALESSPRLAAGIETTDGRQVLTQAVAGMRHQRLALEERVRDAVRAWDRLERDYEAAGKAYEWDAQREAGTRLGAFAQALKRDPQLDSALRERGREFGMAEGSRLERVVQAREVDRVLIRQLGIEHGLRQSRGPSLGM